MNEQKPPEFKQPTKIFGPNLEELLNGAGFYRKKEWVGLTNEDCKGMSAGDKVVAMWANRTLKEKNNV